MAGDPFAASGRTDPTRIDGGDVGGPTVGGVLVVGRAELNDSEQVGVALLQETDGQTQVGIYLIDQEATPPSATSRL